MYDVDADNHFAYVSLSGFEGGMIIVKNELISGSNEVLHPGNSSILNSYPNPFDQSLTIELVLNSKGSVKITLLNQFGQEIQKIFDEIKNFGPHSLILETNNLPAGIYYIKLQTDETINSRKIIKI
jgi:hypothetical protein